MAQGSKEKYTAAQKRKAAHIEKGYEKRGTPKKTAEARAWATVNKQDGGGGKASSGGEHKAAAAAPRKGSTVSWKNGAGLVLGKVLEVFRRKVVKTIKGAKVTRNATPEKPAVLVKSARGGEALHSASEVKRASGKPRARK